MKENHNYIYLKNRAQLDLTHEKSRLKNLAPLFFKTRIGCFVTHVFLEISFKGWSRAYISVPYP
jgi:hypothetical protein